MTTLRRIGLIALTLGSLVGPSRAEILDSQPSGFTVSQTLAIAAAPDKVWRALILPASWWSSDHTFSHDAGNLSLTPRAGGAWIEKLPGGGEVRHLEVVYVDPPSRLRLECALGPLQSMGVAGHLTFQLAPTPGGTTLVETYDVGGHAAGGLDKLAAPVDGVLRDQLRRLKAVVETGKAP